MYSVAARTKGTGTISPADQLFLQHQHLKGESFAGLKLASFDVLGCTFERCDFSRLKAPHIVLAAGKEPSRYVECVFDGSRMRRLQLGQARFERCRFLDVKIESMFSHGAEFVDCVFSGLMRTAAIYGRVVGIDAGCTSRKVNEIRGNDFSAMKLSDVDFRQGVDLRLQKLPVGGNYLYLENAETRLAAVRRRYTQQAASQHRQDVLKYIGLIEDQVRDGQADMFLCKDSVSFMSERAVTEFWKELAEVPE